MSLDLYPVDDTNADGTLNVDHISEIILFTYPVKMPVSVEEELSQHVRSELKSLSEKCVGVTYRTQLSSSLHRAKIDYTLMCGDMTCSASVSVDIIANTSFGDLAITKFREMRMRAAMSIIRHAMAQGANRRDIEPIIDQVTSHH